MKTWKNRLIELPCNIGDTVYVPIDFENKIYKGKCVSFGYSKTREIWYCEVITELCNSYEKLSDFGITWFTSEEEAEKALKESVQ